MPTSLAGTATIKTPWWSWLFSVCGALLLHTLSLTNILSSLEHRDTYHSLSPVGQAALALLTAVLCIAALLVIRAAGTALFLNDKRSVSYRALVLTADLLFSIIAFTLLLILAPQVFYMLYLLLFNDLPYHWVIRPAYTISYVWKLLQINPPGNYAAVTSGITLWTLILILLAQHLGPRPRRPSR